MKETMKSIIRFWKQIWGGLTAFIICGSIIALFIASFCIDKNLTLSIMNEWVSLIVGMAALILGIISLFLSFYNVEQSNEVQRDTLKIMNGVKEDITTKLNELQINMNNNFSDIKQLNTFQGSRTPPTLNTKKTGEDWRKVDE